MQFNHDNMRGVYLAQNLINLHVDGQWAYGAVESSLAELFIRTEGLEDQITELHEWTQRLWFVFAAYDTAKRCELINDMLAVGAHKVHLATHDGQEPHLHFFNDEQPLAERVQAITIGGLAVFVVESSAGRMGICSRPGCARAYIDTTRNGRRAYCSALCGNGHAVQRYRERQRAQAGAAA